MPKSTPKTKSCGRCGELKPYSEFRAAGTRRNVYAANCKVCVREMNGESPPLSTSEISATERHRIARKLHYQRNKAYYAERARMRRYGLTEGEFDEMVERQRGACAICKVPLPSSSKQIHVDHDHATGAVRGILCRRCNYGLGQFRDSPQHLYNAYLYLTHSI